MRKSSLRKKASKAAHLLGGLAVLPGLISAGEYVHISKQVHNSTDLGLLASPQAHLGNASLGVHSWLLLERLDGRSASDGDVLVEARCERCTL